MDVNGIYFINAISCHTKFITDEHMANTESITLQNSIKQVKRIYMQHGFKVVNILMNGRFECICRGLANLQIRLNVCSKNEHAREIEQLKIKIKERDRGI